MQSNMGILWYRGNDEKQAVTCCCLLASDSVWGTHLLNMGMLWYRGSNEKQAVTCCCLLASDSVLGVDLLNLYAFPMRCRWSLTISSETWKYLASWLQVWLLSSSMAAFRGSSSRTCGWPMQGSSQKNRSPDLNFWDQNLVVIHSQHYPQFPFLATM